MCASVAGARKKAWSGLFMFSADGKAVRSKLCSLNGECR